MKKVLDRIGLEKYHVRFAEEEIDFMAFLDIKDEHLREMQIPIGPRLKLLREIQRILESTALALEANMDYRDSIVFSYKEMCKVLQGHGYLRKHFETVREFQEALRTALSLDQDSVARLTILYEEADYTKKELDDDHRINAVSALRTVIESLDLNDSTLEN